MADKKYGITLDGQEYEVTVTANGAKSYTIGLDGSFYNTTVRNITLDDISNHIFGIEQDKYDYTGNPIKPVLVTDGTVIENTDYSVEYLNNTNIGTGTVIATAIGNIYTGKVQFEFSIIDGYSIANHVSGLSQTEYTYNGSEIKPAIITDGSVELDTDYIVEYKDNINSGTGTAIVSGTGEYTGSVTYTFTISPDSISNHVFGLLETEYTYNRSEIKPELSTDEIVIANTDYNVEYKDNIDVGTGSVIVTGINNYSGTETYEFIISAELITNHLSGLSQTEYTYTGSEIKPDVITDGTIIEDTDYTVEYKDNINPGNGSVIVTGIDNYSGDVTYIFTITNTESQQTNDSDNTTEPENTISDSSTNENQEEVVNNTTES